MGFGAHAKTGRALRALRHVIVISLLASAPVAAAGQSHGRSPEWKSGRQITNTGDYSMGSVGRALAIDGLGRLHVVWTELNGSSFDVYYSRSLDGGLTWSLGIDLATSPFPASSPNIAVGPDQTIHVAWVDRRGGGAAKIYYKRSKDGGATFDIGRNIGGQFEFDCAAPSISVDANNRVHLAWHVGSTDPGRPPAEVYYTRSLDGGDGFETRRKLNTTTARAAFARFNVEGTPGDLLAISWRDNRRAPDWDVYVAVSTDAGVTFTEKAAVATDMLDWDPDVVVDRAGAVHLAVMTYREEEITIDYFRSTDQCETWTAGQTLSEAVSRFPSWAPDPSRNVLWLFWKDERDAIGDGDRRADVATRYTLNGGTTWSDLEFVTDEGDVEVKFPSPVVGPEGQPAVIWSDRRLGATREDLFFTARSGAPSVGEAPEVNVSTPNGGEKPRRGEAMIVRWSASDAEGLASQEIRLSSDGGATFNTVIASGLNPGDRAFTWEIPADFPKGKRYRIAVFVRDTDGNVASDASDGDFRVRKSTP